MIEAFPLQWPAGFDRTPDSKKKDSQFKTTMDKARKDVLKEIERLRGSAVVISTNIPLKKDGNFYATMRPIDNETGIAVYFTWKGDQYVLACDQYYKMQDNLRAIALSIDAMRGLERWGASDILKRAFSGFKALAQNAGVSNGAWWQVLQVDQFATPLEIKSAYKKLAAYYHPDNLATGNRDMFDIIQAAYQQAIKP